jgi:hypothetical protein
MKIFVQLLIPNQDMQWIIFAIKGCNFKFDFREGIVTSGVAWSTAGFASTVSILLLIVTHTSMGHQISDHRVKCIES